MVKVLSNSGVSPVSGVSAELAQLRLSKGKTHNRVIRGALALSALASALLFSSVVQAREPGQPKGCPTAWCGCYLAYHMGMGHRKDLWRARNWSRVGRATHAQVGAIVVWPHHVGVIVGKRKDGWIVKSGNDGNRVRVRVRRINNAIAFRKL